ncbi:ABC transporter [Candidatus Epulonipiscium fishelsonii]|uniref:ABC transporter n=1 Tax=Candidatus Epulonipiscium fishelsonii TaxID=77094 RepID=A0ACC8XBA3_9FIRM|nr:ABC transporter [Epulopiscium sp. SCG-B05WGA-EpuloA1]ONI39675.1 ABC transporter [Epulopiscium sp. SCG-B11WGA-EpuloA1]
MKNIKKAFGNNLVLKGVDLKLEAGSIHALLGENGTGKSTLMNILSGLLAYDEGEIITEITKNKIAFIHQELALVDDLNIMENLFLGHEIKKSLFVDKKAMYIKSKEILERMNITINPKTIIKDLTPSYKQIIEIAKALLKDAKIIIMDEPTTSLTEIEIQSIFSLMKVLKSQGVSLVFISHKLNEVIEICDRVTIMRDGEVVYNGNITADVNEHDLAQHMVGKELSYENVYNPRTVGDVVLELCNLNKERIFENINMSVHKGEIVGVTGLLGDGRSEVFEAVFGVSSGHSGKIIIKGKEANITSTAKALSLGIGYIPSNRKQNGIVKDLSVGENMILPSLNKLKNNGLISKSMQSKFNEEYVDKLSIKVNKLNNLITSLSGGNQQKVVIARVLGTAPDIVILDNPTQGVDIGAKLEIYNIIMNLAKEGVSFIILSNEAQEIFMTCDRTYVMFQGQIRHEFSRAEMSEENIMLVATGGQII